MEEFNIFKNLHLTEDGHTSILKRILSPRGSHAYNDVFLQLFFEVLGISYDKTKKWEVYSKKSGERGFVDLIIRDEDSDTVIVIENKIRGAIDQSSQLYRYWRNEIYPPLHNSGKYIEEDLISERIAHIKDITDKFKLIYLTYDGNKGVSELSLNKPYSSNNKYEGFPDKLLFPVSSISYKKEIKEWLINCKRMVDEKKSIRFYLMLEQYIEHLG